MRLLTAVIGTALFATTAWPQATLPEWSLTPLLRIGSIDGPDALSYIGPIVVSPVSGTIVAAETTQNILAFSADGTFLRRFGQPGQGPGEFQTLRTISWANGEVYAFDLSLRVSRFTEEGVVIETRAMEPEPLGPMNRRARPVAPLRGGNYLGVGTLSSENEGPRVGIDEEYLASVNTAGEAKILDTLHRLTEMVRVPPIAYIPVPMLPTSEYAVHPDGSRIAIVPVVSG